MVRNPKHKQVQQYLYSIKRTEIAIMNLERAIENLETRRESPPTWMHNPDAISVSGGIDGSKQEAWAEFNETYPARKSFLEDKLEQNKIKIEEFNRTLGSMVNEAPWGSLGVEIVRHKYVQRISPDQVIFTMFLFCTEETFYRAHRRALQYFIDTLPHVFKNDSIVTVK